MEALDITTLIFALVAIFVVWKLRSVLGTRAGHEKPPTDFAARRENRAPVADDAKVVRLPSAANDTAPPPPAVPDADRWKGFAEPGTPVAQGLDAIRAIDPQFDAANFIAGASAAYEMIVVAFAAGDRKTLKGLLSRDVYESFSAAITERETRGESVAMTFVSIDKAQIEQALMRGPVAHVTVRFQSKLITATSDKAGAVIDGNPDKIVDIVDVWTFSRDMTSRDPNWPLVATEAGQ